MQRSSTSGVSVGMVPIVDWVDVVDALRPFLARERTAMTFRFRGYLRPEGDVAGVVRAHDDRVEIRLDDARCLTAPDRSTRLRRLASCLSGWGVTVTVAAGDVVALQVPEAEQRFGRGPRLVTETGERARALELAIEEALENRPQRLSATRTLAPVVDDAGHDSAADRSPEGHRGIRMTWWDARLKARGGARPRLRPSGPLRLVGEDGPA